MNEYIIDEEGHVTYWDEASPFNPEEYVEMWNSLVGLGFYSAFTIFCIALLKYYIEYSKVYDESIC